ncbi:amidohydrolase family protein [Kordiimonas sp.]|uniref:amidohydrolase family protein n=1 Tax=Kordiimonas sp. TaxID=1970157 RepID=UPI003A938404
MMMGKHFILSFLAVFVMASSAAGEGWDITATGVPHNAHTITTDEGTWMSVDVSPDGSTIAFDLLGDIYIMPASGGAARLISAGPALERMPRFSPDGSRILILSDRSGSDNLWTIGLDGGHEKQLTFEGVNVLSGPAWGPGGDYVIATQHSALFENIHTASLRLFHSGGGAGVELVPSPGPRQNVQEAQFSPDGRYLYYTEQVGEPYVSYVHVDANHANYGIRRRDMQTGETITLIAGFGGALTPEISPDGRMIAFVRRVKDKTVLFRFDTETNEQIPVFDGLDRDLQAEFIAQGTFYPQYGWFPDGRHVAIWAGGKIQKIDMENGAAEVIPFTTSAEHQLAKAPRVSHDLAPDVVTAKAVRQLAATAGGDGAVFHALGQLWHQSAGEAKANRVTDEAGLEFEPAFASDGKTLAYVHWRDEEGSRLKVLALGGDAKTLLHTRGMVREPAFSHDGKTLLYRIEAGSKCMGGYGTDVGIYTADLMSGNTKRVLKAGEAPQFSPDGSRIYFTTSEWGASGQITRIESVNAAGFDRRVHALAYGSDTLELNMSPDLNWIAFKENRQYYVMPYMETGTPIVVSSSADGARKLTSLSGYDITWAADSKSLHWVLGQSLYRADVASGTASVQATLVAEAPAQKPKGMIAFTGGRIITMRGDEVIERGTVLVEGDRIKAVGADIVVPAVAKIVDVSGKTLMPGFVNMHGHLEDCYYSSVGLMPEKQPSHYASLAFGATTNYDPYATELPSYAMSEMQAAGKMVGPRTISVGGVVYGRSGKGDPVYEPIFSLEDADALMTRKRALGGTIIKSYRQPMRSQRQMLVRAGHEAGVMVDIEGESHFYNNISAVLDGHTALEHNFPVATLYDDIIQLMAAGDTPNTPTIIATFGEFMGENFLYAQTRPWEDARIQAYVPAVTSSYSALGVPYSAPAYVRGMTGLSVADELWDVGFKSVARSVAKLDAAGATINVGSHSQIQGLAVHWEMWLMAEGGMPNARILKAATINGAKTLGLEGQIGSLEAGKLADLIVLERNPLEDIRNTDSLIYTVVGGRIYDPMSMNEVISADVPRSRFYWELPDYHGIDWNEAWAGQ